MIQEDWLEPLGDYWLTFLEDSPAGSVERRILFEGALDVDFNFFSLAQFREVLLDMGEGQGVGFADVDLARISDVRSRIPALNHRRPIPAVMAR